MHRSHKIGELVLKLCAIISSHFSLPKISILLGHPVHTRTQYYCSLLVGSSASSLYVQHFRTGAESGKRWLRRLLRSYSVRTYVVFPHARFRNEMKRKTKAESRHVCLSAARKQPQFPSWALSTNLHTAQFSMISSWVFSAFSVELIERQTTHHLFIIKKT